MIELFIELIVLVFVNVHDKHNTVCEIIRNYIPGPKIRRVKK